MNSFFCLNLLFADEFGSICYLFCNELIRLIIQAFRTQRHFHETHSNPVFVGFIFDKFLELIIGPISKGILINIISADNLKIDVFSLILDCILYYFCRPLMIGCFSKICFTGIYMVKLCKLILPAVTAAGVFKLRL